MTLLLNPVTRWYCPNGCDVTDVTRKFVRNRYHTCAKLRGLQAPLMPEGIKAKVEAREREDYVGKERVQTDENGRPVMSVVTVRDTGEDCVVFAPTATAQGDT